MAYTDFKNLGQVVQKHQIAVKNTYFLPKKTTIKATELLREEVKFAI